jgi:hypothetical protein
MRNKEGGADFHRAADAVRLIAMGIFDRSERGLVMKFIEDSEKLAEEKAAKGK